MIPLILEGSHYKNFLEFVEGNHVNKTVHVATLHVPGSKAFVCKLMPIDSVRLGNEIIGNIMCRATKVPCPQSTAVLWMSVEQASKVLSRPIERFYQTADGRVVMWCAEKMPYRSHKAEFKASGARTEATITLLQYEAARRLAALDHMSGNGDRHDGNYLWISKTECIAVDNEMLFALADWTKNPLNFQTQNQLLMEAQRHGHISANGGAQSVCEQLCAAMVAYGELHYLSFGQAYAHIAEIIGSLYGEHAAQNVLSSLCERSFCHWMKYQLGLI